MNCRLKNNAIKYTFGNMKKILILCFTAVLVVFVSQKARAGMAIKTKKLLPADAELYIVSVGIDAYQMLYAETRGSGNDVKLLTDSITKKFQTEVGDTSSKRIHVYQLIDKNATRDNVVKALQDVIKNIKQNDLLFFSFSGHTFEYIPGTQTKLDYPYVATYFADTTYPREPETFGKTFLGLKELRTLLELMPNNYQFILFDACNEKDMAYKFASTMLADIPSEQSLSQRKRIFVATEGLSFERYFDKCGRHQGALSYALASNPNLLSVFNNRSLFEEQMQQQIAREHELHNLVYSVFDEQEVLSNLRRFCVCKPGGSRGADVVNVDIVPTVPVKKDKALIICTQQYDFWTALHTPYNDAFEMEKLLKEKYNFDTRLLYNISKDSLFTELKALVRDSVSDQQQLLLFFAGHGYYNPETLDGYLVMKESKKPADDPNMQSYFQFSYLSSFANNLQYQHVFVLLDVCFGGKFGGNNREVVLKPQSTPSDITPQAYRERKKVYKGRLYLASGIKEVDDVSKRDFRHSPFADKVLELLKNAKGPVVPQDMFQYCDKSATAPVFRKLPDHDDNSEFFLIPTVKR